MSSSKRRITVGDLPSSSSSKNSRGGGESPPSRPRPSVFSRLGTKGSKDPNPEKSDKSASNPTSNTICRPWADTGNCPFGSKCKFSHSHTLVSPSKRSSKKRKESPLIDPDWENWDEKHLDYDDELMLEKKRQLLQRELAKQLEEPGDAENRNKTQQLQQAEALLIKQQQEKQKQKQRKQSESTSESESSSESSESESSESGSSSSSEESSSEATATVQVAAQDKKKGNKASVQKKQPKRASSSSSNESRPNKKRERPKAAKQGGLPPSKKRKGPKGQPRPVMEGKGKRIRTGGRERVEKRRGAKGVKRKATHPDRKRSSSPTIKSKPTAAKEEKPSSDVKSQPIRKGMERDKFGFYHAPPPAAGNPPLPRDEGIAKSKSGKRSQQQQHNKMGGKRGGRSMSPMSVTKSKSSGKSTERTKRSTSSDRRGGSSPLASKRRSSHSPHGKRTLSPSQNKTSYAAARSGSAGRDRDMRRTEAAGLRQEEANRRPSRPHDPKDDRRQQPRNRGQKGGRNWEEEQPRKRGYAEATRYSRPSSERDYRDRSSPGWEEANWASASASTASNRVRGKRGRGSLTGANTVSIEPLEGPRRVPPDRRRPPAASPQRGLHRDGSSRSIERLLPPQALLQPQSRERSLPREKSRLSRERSPRHLNQQPRRSRDRSPRPKHHEKRLSRSKEREMEAVAASKEEEADNKNKLEEGEMVEVVEKEKQPQQPQDLEEFSDFGDSDDEILNKEANCEVEAAGGEEGEVAEEEEALAENLSLKSEQQPLHKEKEVDDERESAKSGSSARKDSDLLEGISDEDLDISDDDESRTKAKLVDALGVDWSQLMTSKEAIPPLKSETGSARKRWTAAAIFNRIGLPKAYLDQDFLDSLIEKANSQTGGGEKVELLHPIAGLHCQLKARQEERKNCFALGPFTRALSARKDIAIRRRLCNLYAEEDFCEIAQQPNSDLELFRTAVKLWKA